MAKKTAKKKTAKKLAKIEPKKVPVEQAKQEEDPQPSEWKENVIAVLVVAIVILAMLAYFNGWFAPEEIKLDEIPRHEVRINDDPMLGNDSARVTIIEFSDFFCTACKQFHEQAWPRLKANYIDTGKVRFVYRDFPLESLHEQTFKASGTVTCAGKQDAYWEFHNAFYERQDEIGEELIVELVTTHGLDQEVLDTCRAEEWPYKEAQFDFEDGKRSGGVSGTPTFFINGRKLVGNQDYEDFATMIEEELQQ
ncbi:thioredoxin domain-containing protein [Candidatus Woesearchaeota archaeon]|nr:thioredoxin domain-containing protein [Candidatus Woesearchaeota archaeon]